MKDYIVRATAANGQIRAFFATTKYMVQTARKIHDTSPVATAALGRTMTAAAIMGLMLKGDKDIMTIQLKGNGPLKGIVVTGDSKANVKGYVHQPHVDIPLNQYGKLDVGGAIGEGTISVLKDIGLKEPYIGQIPLISGEVADDLTYYFAKSEQTPSVVALGVLIDVDTSVKQSGGFIIQLMPDAEESTIDALENSIRSITSVTQMLEAGNTPEDMLELILGFMRTEILDILPTQFYCNCSRERVEKALISIGLKDLNDILTNDKGAKLNCHFCGKEYKFNEKQIEEIIADLKLS